MSNLETDLLRLLTDAVSGGASCMERKRQVKAPKDTGKLAGSIGVKPEGRSGDRISVVFEQDEEAAPHGPIINNPQAGRITAKNAQALGPFQHAGQTMFRRSVEQSTVHKGWWDDFDYVREFESCVRGRL